jgi:prepilin-type N-terminal cleavage/methylation domain-containing protein
MKKNYLKKQQGFSLVEMLVSISILLLVVTGPMTVTSRTSKSSTFATEQVQAFFLAQEGLELAQKSRDDLLLIAGATPWSSFVDTSNAGAYRLCFAGAGCGLEWANSGNILANPVDCTTISNCRLNLKTNPDRSLYSYSTSNSVLSPYTRKINFTNTGGNSVRVVSTVTWRTGSLVAEQKVEVETYLYNIYASP